MIYDRDTPSCHDHRTNRMGAVKGIKGNRRVLSAGFQNSAAIRFLLQRVNQGFTYGSLKKSEVLASLFFFITGLSAICQ